MNWYITGWCFVVMKTYGIVIAVSCTCDNIVENMTVNCKCSITHTGEWSYMGNVISACSNEICFPARSNGNTFSATDSSQTISMSNFNLKNCLLFMHKDLASNEDNLLPYCPVLTMTKPGNDGPLNIVENTPKEFICTITSGSPAGYVDWYTDSGTPSHVDDVKITSGITNSSSSTDNKEYTTTSILWFSPSRSYTGNRIYCKGTNKPEQTPLTSQRKPFLNILYYSSAPSIVEGKSYRVIENMSGQLSCVVTGGNPSPTVQWNCNGGNVSQTSASNGDEITSTVTWKAHRGNSVNCICKTTQTELQPRNATTQVTVLYPPSSPTISINGQPVPGNISLKENSSRQIKCESIGSPEPTIEWVKFSGSSASSAGHFLNFTNIQKTDTGSYTCNANNKMDPTGRPLEPGKNTSSRQIVVLYPPSMLNFYHGSLSGPLISSKSIDVIKGDTIIIGCKSMDGEPAPAIQWSGQTTDNPILTLQQIQESQTRKTCTATNRMLEFGSNIEEGTASDHISFNILIPPSVSNCTFYNNKTNSVITKPNTLMILEGRSFTLTCSAVGKPSPGPLWRVPASTSSSWSVAVSNVTRHRSGMYVFFASSEMKPSFQPSRIITANETIRIHILYPPVVDKLNNISRLEGSKLQVNCNVTEGFPVKTTTKWTRDTDASAWENTLLDIASITKADAGKYTCIASNTMTPSGENHSYPGTDEKHFVLTVLYEASVTSFYVDGFKENGVVIVDESILVLFKCVVDSLPTAVITLKNRSESLLSKTSNTLDYPLYNASCLDAGTYSCSARNEHNKGVSLKTVDLFVNCKPRSADTVNLNRSSEQNETFTFTFNAIAYPVPVFIWQKWDRDGWKNVQNDTNVHITSSELQSNLTIRRVNMSDFGKYLLVVRNDFGYLELPYQLEPDDEPDAPTHFKHIEHLAKESSIQLEWKPGFNGGPPQTFYIKYKKVSSQTWNFVSVPDNGKQTMQYMLNGLVSDTQYQLIIYSSNRKGNSTESELLIAKTTGKPKSNIGAMVGGAVGGGVGCAILAIIAIFVFRRYRFSKGDRGSDTELKRRSISEDSDDEDGMRDNPMYGTSSAVVAGTSGTDNIYSKPQKLKKPKASNVTGNADVYAVVNKPKKIDKKKQKKEKLSANVKSQTGDVYENVEPKKDPRKGDNTYENPDDIATSKQPKKKNVNKDGLIYADLAFNDQQKGQKKLVIIGSDDRTPYAQVDFTKKADPLPESDEENP